MTTIAFLSASGGVGKTTMALHLAHKFLEEGIDVLLVDLDPSAGLSAALLGDGGVGELEAEGRTVGDALLRFMKGQEVDLADYVVAVNVGRYRAGLVPGGDSLSDAMGIAWFSGSRPSPERIVKDFLERSGAGRWGVVLLDTLPFYERRYTLTAAYTADKIVVVTHPYGSEPARVRRMYGKLAEVAEAAVDIKARVLINKVDVRTKEGREAYKIVERTLNLPRFQTAVANRVAYTRVPAMEYVKDKDARKELDSLYREFKEWLSVELSVY
ncbi:MAG: ParA family protein [Thermoproteus sp.]